jgi:hypothetical protein
MYHAELNMNEARRRVVLSTVGDTQAGDVFYLVSDPATVWYKGDTGMDQEFCCLGNDTWFTWHMLGDLRQRVVVIHSTKEKQ